jgi:hypothetical protein
MSTLSWIGVTGGWGADSVWQPTTVPNETAAEVAMNAAGTFAVTAELGAMYALDLASLATTGATLDAQGTVMFVGAAIDLELTVGSLLPDSGSALNCPTIFTNGGAFVAAGGTLNSPTYQGDLALGSDTNPTIVGGLTADDVDGDLPGALVHTEHSVSITIGVTQTFDDMSRNVTGAFDATASNWLRTVGTNALSNMSTENGLLNVNLVNQGSIVLSAGFFSTINGGSETSSFSNQGLMSISRCVPDILANNFSNSGGIDIARGGDLWLEQLVTLRNAGGLTIEAGGTATLSGSLTLVEPESSGIAGNGDILTEHGGTLVNVTATNSLELPSGVELSTASSLMVLSAAAGAAGAIIVDDSFNPLVQTRMTLGTACKSILSFINGGAFDDAVLSFPGASDVVLAQTGAPFPGSDWSAALSGGDVEFQGNVFNLGGFPVISGAASAEDQAPNNLFTNLSTIDVGTASFSVDADIFLNAGLIDIGYGGLFSVAANIEFDNSVVLVIESGGTVNRLDSTMLSGLTCGGIVNDGGALIISGSLDL